MKSFGLVILLCSLFVAPLATLAEFGSEGGNGADGMTSGAVVYDILEYNGASVTNSSTERTIIVESLECIEIDGLHYKNACVARDSQANRKQIVFQAKHFIYFLIDIDSTAVESFKDSNGITHWVIKKLRCSESLLPPQPDQLDENGYYNPSKAFSCTLNS